ncbi:MAG: hypothetical protein RMJ55_10975, partial [Roseiflexaceae bacterium]|nr:hypothetical protein [Roseiflexaceae bacterium]
LLESGLVEKRDTNLTDSLFPELERIVLEALGPPARALLVEAYVRAGIHDQDTATPEQITTALNLFETSATRAFGAERISDPLVRMRSFAEQVFRG